MGRKKEGKNSELKITMPGQIEMKPQSWFKPYANNARTHSETQLDEIAASMEAFGFTNPILAKSDGTIIAGHGRIEAATTRLFLEELPVIIIDHLSDKQVRKLVLADNKIAMNAGWDEELLARELYEITQEFEEGDDPIAVMGFDDDELDSILEGMELGEEEDAGEGEGDEEEQEIVVDTPVTALGDVWILGNHRLICGDSTKKETLEKLMAGKKAAMVFTDPPYGMSYGGGRAEGEHSLDKKTGGVKVKAHGMIINDDLQGENLIKLVAGALERSKENVAKDAPFYVCFTWRTYTEFAESMARAKKSIDACIVWDKQSIGLGLSDYRPQHEFIFYSKGKWYGDKDQSDVWYSSRGNTGAYVHPTQKPVELIEKAVANSSVVRDVVLDVFGGSGSTLIACEKTRRHARLIDLDPKYCDAIVMRWQNLTGQKATLEKTNKTFANMRKERGIA